ncbi:MAG: adenosine kinase [Pseudomonadota bacterium]
MEKKYDIFGLGNPLVDVIGRVDDEFISKMGLEKGIMQLIDRGFQEKLLQMLEGRNLNIISGGSASNTMIALSHFGINSVFAGKVANDSLGRKFVSEIERANVTSSVTCGEGDNTGTSIVLVTQDGERTMNTYLGMCRKFSIEDLDIDKLLASRILYFTGYMWDTDAQKEAAIKALDLALENNIDVIFDVADPFAVSRNKDVFNDLIKKYVKIVFANEEEVKMLTGIDDPKKAALELGKHCEIAIVKLGGHGSLVVSDDRIIEIPVCKVDLKDTTGAGDMFAAGFIYGFIKGYDLEKSGKIASFSAACVVKQLGARLDYSIKDDIEKMF